MKKILMALIILVNGFVNANAENYIFNQSGWQLTSNLLLIADWAQTRHIAINDDYIETNPILGTHPTKSEVNKYFISALILNNLIGHYAGDKWYMIVSVNQAYYVGNNASLGIKFNF